jgi:hypothetical protein
MNENLPAGFYKGEDGVDRYWDGSQWLEPSAGNKKRGGVNKAAVLGFVGVLALGAAGAGGFAWFSNQQQQQLELKTQAIFEERSAEVRGFLKNAVESCSTGDGAEVDERFLAIDGKGEDDYSGTSYIGVTCVNDMTGMPPAVQSRFGSTNSLQGLVESEWTVLDGDAEIQAQWSYHPSSGPNVSMEITSVYLEDFDYEKHKELIDEADLEAVSGEDS